MEWQTIETAPMDGTSIIGYFPDQGFQLPIVMQCTYDDGWWPDIWEGGEEPLHPTHWMPLPDAPK